MSKIRFASRLISSAGYDAQKELLEIEFAQDGQVWQYWGVPEELWYRFRQELRPDNFFNFNIKGRYRERRVFTGK